MLASNSIEYVATQLIKRLRLGVYRMANCRGRIAPVNFVLTSLEVHVFHLVFLLTTHP